MSLDSEITPLLDDRQEWLRFSQPSKKAPTQVPDCWDSHVVIEGMHCAACAFNIESALLSVPGVQSVEVSASTHRAKVVWSEQQVLPSRWFEAIARAGYRALPAADSTLRAVRLQETRQALWRWLVAGFCMMQVMMYAYPSYVAKAGDITPDVVQLLRWASWVLSLPVILFSCGPFFRNALLDIRLRRISMDFPVALGMLIAFLLSSAATFDPSGRFGGEVYYDSLTMFVFFLLTGRWLELRLRDRTAGSLEALMNRLPDTVLRQTSEGQFERITVRRICVGDVLHVLPGESFAADGVVLQGETMVDEALLTGESHPQLRQSGQEVVAGSHNLSAAVLIRVTQVGEGTQFARIVSLMEDASLQKPRLAALADRIAKPFLIGVLLLAGVVAVYWWPTNPNHALMLAVAVLVVTCPCALSLATPAAMLASAGSLARKGILVRRLQAIEALADVDVVIFDKTGTLTRDAQRIERTWVAQDIALQDDEGRASAENHALTIAAALAKHSLHPISKALVSAHERFVQSITVQTQNKLQDSLQAKAQEQEASPRNTLNLSEVQERVAQGLESKGEQPYRLGSASFCKEWGITLPDEVKDAQVHLCSPTHWMASWGFAEDVREDAASTVKQLHELSLRVQLLSGDQTQSVERVAHSLALDEAYGACTPQQKLDHLQALQARGFKVLMIGDGLNDGPVLAGAHVSMAFGQAAALTQSNADLVLLGAELAVVPQSLSLASKSMRIVKQNLAWAATYNLVCVPLAAMGYLPAWAAGLGMACSSLLVVLNALRLSGGI